MVSYVKQFIHNGIMMPKKFLAKGLHIIIRGERKSLTPEQEEMAVAWVKKIGTDYSNDKRFVSNFFKDFSKALGVREILSPEDIAFSEIIRVIEEERNMKNNLSKEEKKKLAQVRKAEREKNKEKYGYSIVDAVKVEI